MGKVVQKVRMLLAKRYWKKSRAAHDLRLTMLGDSITADIGQATNTFNHGCHGEKTSDMIKSMEEFYRASINQSDVVVIMIGVNDLIQGVPIAQVRENYETILAAIPLAKPLLWLSVLPTNLVEPVVIAQANKHIERLCRARPRAVYANVAALLCNDQGSICDRFYKADGLHLNGMGYEELVHTLNMYLKIISQMLGTPSPELKAEAVA